MNLQCLCLLALCAIHSGCGSTDEKLEATYTKSVAWLWAQQAPDGGWHSETHTVLRDGVALTPYILYYLLQVPDSVFHRDDAAVKRGIEYIRSTAGSAFHGLNGSMTDYNYPNYSAAYALRVLHLTKQDTTLQDLLGQYLRRQQYIEQRGIFPKDLAYGGWGFGEPGIAIGKVGHVDLSHTRRVIEAMIEKADAKAEVEVQIIGVRQFLQGVQRDTDDPRLYDGCQSRKHQPYDGGFVYSIVTLAANKSKPVQIEGAGIHYPSYATATCDGLLALYALGDTLTSSYRDARQWLTLHQRIDVVEGLSPDDPGQWDEAMHYYHWSVRAEAMTKAGIEGPWRKELKKALVREQKYNGFYLNPLGGINKENDPLMATIFAIQAMTALRVG